MREVEARLKLSAVDQTAKSFEAISRRLDMVNRKSQQVTRTQTAMARVQEGVSRAALASGAALGGAIAPAALAYGAQRSLVRYAAVERSVERIGITAGATAEETRAAFGVIDKAAHDYAVSQDKVTEGLDAIVAAGRNMQDALAFLPSVVQTAQAAGAEVTDIATTADALASSFKIGGQQMQGAFDILVKAGKEGKFELRDMARYIPSMGPAFEALGYKGEAGVKKIAAALQIVRQRTGSSEEAATALQNVIQKMETEETAKRFKSFGIDLRQEMAAARASGKDLIDVFVELSNKALKGDLSKLPLLFGDAQVIGGMRALQLGAKDMAEMFVRLGEAAGESQKDVSRLLKNTQADIDRLSNSWDRLIKNAGAQIAPIAAPVMENLTAGIENDAARAVGYDKERIGNQSNADINAAYWSRYKEVNPETSPLEFYQPWSAYRASQNAALAAVGEGRAGSIYDDLNRIASSRQTSRFGGRADAEAASAAYEERHRGSLDGYPARTGLPLPTPADRGAASSAGAQPMSLAEQYAEYGRGRRIAEGEEARLRAAAWAKPGVDQGAVMPSQAIVDRHRRRDDDGADALRAALESGGAAVQAGGTAIEASGDKAGTAIKSGGQDAASAIERAAASIVTAGLTAAAAISGAKIAVPRMPGAPLSNRAPSVTMPTAGMAGAD